MLAPLLLESATTNPLLPPPNPPLFCEASALETPFATLTAASNNEPNPDELLHPYVSR
jgi:hypothetical protein